MVQCSISLKRAFITALMLFYVSVTLAQPPTISYTSAIPGLSVPIDIVNAGDGSNRLFVAQQDGIIRVWNGFVLTQFANFGTTGSNIISYSAGDEQGLLSIVFHPNFDGVSNRYFFIYYTDLSGNIAVTRYQTTLGNSNTADMSTGVNFLTVPHPGQSNHNGGKLNFGTDGYLYFALGDGGGSNDMPNNAQTGTVLLGKMLRIDINTPSVSYGNYSVPADNPYIGDPNIDDRIWALGLRNPYRWSFDRLTGDMWIGDVGQGAQEEIDFRPAGSTGMVNYGWRCFEGYPSTPGVADCTPVNYVPPVYDYPNPNPGSSAVTGGFVYRGSEYPNFRNYYIATDVYSGTIYLLWPNGSGGFDSSAQASTNTFIVAFGEGEDGTLYAVSQGTNTVYKVVATGGVVIPVTLASFSGIGNRDYNELKWITSSEQNTSRFHIEFSKEGFPFLRAGTVAATRNPLGSNYSFKHYINSQSDLLYRLAIENDNGSTTYSPVIRLRANDKKDVRVYPTIANGGTVTLELNGNPVKMLRIINTDGMQVYRQNIQNFSNRININLPALASGMYLLQLMGEGYMKTERIFIQ